MKQKPIKAKNTFTVAGDREIKNLLAINRAVSKEKMISIRETRRTRYGFYSGKLSGSTRTLTSENYEELKEKGKIKTIKVDL